MNKDTQYTKLIHKIEKYIVRKCKKKYPELHNEIFDYTQQFCYPSTSEHVQGFNLNAVKDSFFILNLSIIDILQETLEDSTCMKRLESLISKDIVFGDYILVDHTCMFFDIYNM